MWMHLHQKKCQEGICRDSQISATCLVILFICHICVNAQITDAAVPRISKDADTPQDILKASENIDHKCTNMTSVLNPGNFFNTFICFTSIYLTPNRSNSS